MRRSRHLAPRVYEGGGCASSRGGVLPPAFMRGVPPKGGGGSKKCTGRLPRPYEARGGQGSGGKLAPRVYEGGAPIGAGGEKMYREIATSGFALLAMTRNFEMFSGGQGCSATICRGGAVPLPAILGAKLHCRRQSGNPIGLWAGHCPAPTRCVCGQWGGAIFCRGQWGGNKSCFPGFSRLTKPLAHVIL